MATRTTESVRYSGQGMVPCPRCGGDLFRIPRRPIDRFASLFVPRQRFRCNFFSCNWVGNLRVARRDFDATGLKPGASGRGGAGVLGNTRAPKVPRSFVLQMVFAVAGVVAVVIVSMTDWFSDPEASKLSDEQWAASASREGGSRLGKGSAPATGAKQPAAALGRP